MRDILVICPLELGAAAQVVDKLSQLPEIVEECRKDGKSLQVMISNHRSILSQRDINASSWFGFSLVIRAGSKLTRKALVAKLNELGFECRPIVAGNFAKNEVVKYFDSEEHGSLKNAEHIDRSGLFVGNHHYPIPEAFAALAKL